MTARIQIQTTHAAVGIETTPPQLKIQSNHNLLRMRRVPARLMIHSQQAKVKIDQSQCFYESGLKSPLRLAGDFYRTSLSRGIQAIGRIASESRRFLAIEQPGNPTVSIARSNMVRQRQFGLVSMPRSRPKITVEPASVDVQYEPGDVETEWNTERPRVEYEAGEVHIFLRQKPKVEVSVVYDKATGRSYVKSMTPEEEKSSRFHEML